MRVAIVSWTPQQVRKFLKGAGLRETGRRPDAVIAYGGEGTLLWAELVWPGVPKLLLNHPRTCRAAHNLAPLLGQLARGDYDIEELPKVAGRAPRGRLVGMNEVYLQFHPPTALRFSVAVNGRSVASNVVGDGLILATFYGSTGYFRTVTGKTFTRGLGMALNNCTRRAGPWFLPESAEVLVKIERGPGWMVADADKRLVPLRDGDVVRLHRAARPARIIRLRGRPLKIDVTRM